jgi:hypothetical protein
LQALENGTQAAGSGVTGYDEDIAIDPSPG